MKAVLCTRYGPPDVLRVDEVNTPVPGDREILIRIHASTVTMGDCELRGLTLPLWTRIPLRFYLGYRKPKNFVPGMEFSGAVESIGRKVTRFKKGDLVFGSTGMRMGANAEYQCISESHPIAIKPTHVRHEEATTLAVGGINALHFLRKAAIKADQHILIIKAGGSIGSYGVQLAKLYGAEVTAVDGEEKLEMLVSLGADHVIDYKKRRISETGKKYDVIFDMIYGSSFSECRAALKSPGYYLMANPDPLRMIRGAWVSKISRKKVIFDFAVEKTNDLSYLAKLIEDGKIKAVIDKIYPLEKVAEAHEYVQNGHKKGNVVVIPNKQVYG